MPTVESDLARRAARLVLAITLSAFSACAGVVPAPVLPAQSPADPAAPEGTPPPGPGWLFRETPDECVPPAGAGAPQAHDAAAAVEGQALYACPFHPEQTQPFPGACCVCGTTLRKAEGAPR